MKLFCLFFVIVGVFAFYGEYICYILLKEAFYEKMEENRIID